MSDAMVDVKEGSKKNSVCLICYSDFEVQESTATEESESYLKILCKALGVKVSKKLLLSVQPPLCLNCVVVLQKLKEIEEELFRLEKTFQEEAEALKNLLKDGARNRETMKCPKDEEDEWCMHFRRQVLGIKNRGAVKERKQGKKPSTSLNARNKTGENEILVETPKSLYGLRRSGRKTIKRICNEVNEDSGQEAVADAALRPCGVFTDDNSIISPVKTDPVEVDDFENGYIPESIKTDACDDDDRLKSELDIKEERFSESDADLISESRPIRKRTMTNLRKPVKFIRKSSVKRRTVSTAEESEIESDCASELDESRDDYSTEDDEASKDISSTRKWKNDRKNGKLWYDGVEVFVIDSGYKCSICDTIVDGDHNYKTRGKMKKHIIVKHLEKFSCVICNKITSCQKYLDQHIRMVHEKSVMIPCDICGKPFTSINAMRRHKWNHQSENEKQAAIAAGKKQYGNGKLRLLVCGTCGKLCKGPYNLRRHEETHVDQRERQKHMCSFCGSIYSAPESLRSHIKLAHENNNQLQWLQCPHCPKKYPQPGLLDKHMRAHTGEKPFVCEECGAGFSQPNLLKVHILKHKNIRPHKCSDCDMAFYRVYHLRRHREVYHESANPPTKKQPYRSENGTRKTPQKRKKGVTSSTTATVAPTSINKDTTPVDQTVDETPQQHITLGTEDVQQSFEFVPTEGSYSFTSYSFTTSTDS